jgi:ankyrin repeat protein
LTALSWACLKGHYHACETLLNHGSDINHEDINGRIPIDMASFYGDVQLVQLLIDHGSIVDHVDKNGMRALDRAIGCRNVAVVNCLLKKSVKLGKKFLDKYPSDLTLCMRASSIQRFDVLKLTNTVLLYFLWL